MTMCWYMATRKRGEAGLVSLFYAETAGDVETQLNELGQNGVVTPLSKRGLAELVGHYPNEVHDVSDLATGPIMLNYDGRVITIHG